MAYSFRVRGCVLAVVALWLCRQLDETSQQETRALKRSWISEGLMARNRRAFIMVLGFTAAASLCFYTFTTRLYAEVSGKYCGNACQRGEWHYDCRIVVFMRIQPLIGARVG